MVIRSRVPLRLSFGGGGTDVSPYCEEYGGAVINSTIDRYATVSLFPQRGELVTVESIDYDKTINFSIDQYLAYDGHLDLIKGVINSIRNNYNLPSGFNLRIHNDAPPGSGLGSSSAVCVAMIGAFKQWLNLPLTPYDIARSAYNIERNELGIRGGRQDQYASAFGGFNFIEFTSDSIVNPLRLREETIYELNHSLVLAYIGGSHDSSEILKNQIDDMASKSKVTLEALHEIKKLAFEMKNCLVKGMLGKFGMLLDEAWKNKRQITRGITNSTIDELYAKTKRAGALGGKLSGAGGGGFMFFFVDIDKKYSVIKELQSQGAQILNYSFTTQGLHTWEVK